MRKLLSVLLCLFALLFLFNCDPAPVVPQATIEAGYSNYYALAVLINDGPAPGLEISSIVDTTTYTFANFAYLESTYPNARVSGTIIRTNDGVTSTEVSDLNFSNDPFGVKTLETNGNSLNGSGNPKGTVTVNGAVRPYSEMADYINGLE